MARIAYPETIADAPEASQPLLSQAEAALGKSINLHRLVGTSPQTIEGLLSLNGALGKGKLKPALREQIALAVANVNGCTYCNAAHSFVASQLLKLDAETIEAARQGRSHDAKLDAALTFARQVATARGGVSEAELEAVRAAGYSDAEVLEIIGHVVLNTFTNYVNEVFKTDVDFPQVEAVAA
ncbi:MAG: carboxymuconolactone decarboxylase family protein [Sphingomonas sp.]|nr:carboxymuconolactone decarboxylase family protein [Sphingomonas sp.]